MVSRVLPAFPPMPQHEDFNACPAFICLLGIQTQVITLPQQGCYWQLSPESETPVSETLTSHVTPRIELRVERGLDKPLPRIVSLARAPSPFMPAFKGMGSTLPPPAQRRTRNSSSKGSCPRHSILPSYFCPIYEMI